MKNFILFVIVLVAAFLFLTRFDIGGQTPPDFSNQDTPAADIDPRTGDLEDFIPKDYNEGLSTVRVVAGEAFEKLKIMLNELTEKISSTVEERVEGTL